MSSTLKNGYVPTFQLVHAVLSHFTDVDVFDDLQRKFKFGLLDMSR